ncbi:hypothetical protein [Paraburkholderia caribensis]|uniref:hypothetical protein n=1 Tax=Paraburkholderia caribensis TaxID=75105 RepID=UPI001CB38773|nr:hypothetical protein [Paraburkholderia caribensis]CAG9256153.1 conserved hypothetical protein [Paraburkholderia caribensis]
MSDTPKVIAISWFMKSEYDRARAAFTDGDGLPDSFLKWERSAQQAHKRCLAQGLIVVKAHIKLDEFIAWCNARGLEINSRARLEFANAVAYEYAKKLDQNSHS